MNEEKMNKIIDKIIEKNGKNGKFIKNFHLSQLRLIGLDILTKLNSIEILNRCLFEINDELIAYFITYTYSFSEDIVNVAYFIKDHIIVEHFMNFEPNTFTRLYKERETYLDSLLADFMKE